ncbi:hypothetical protein TWF481_006630 [Arthrobotrys musiformis]|uniref:Serine protease n=1 Tax=Arthrobotrys musiformis TaxID=47236 RepID=A0AAV9W936_9PEZI
MIDSTLSPLFYDAGWNKRPDPGVAGGLKFAKVGRRNEWIVKLQFQQGGKTSTGTGFYLNVPDMKSNIILTAGHNLIDEKGNESKNLEILRPKGSSTKEEIIGKFYIPKSYRENPTAKNAINDYGAIITKRGEGVDTAKGFGFSLKTGGENLKGRPLEVSGYRGESDPGEPHTSSGHCLRSLPDQIEYEVMTEPGLSGSPVYLPYKGHDVAVAIHHGHKKGKAIGTRLDERVLCDIFRFAGVGHEGKSLKVVHPKAHSLGMYLRFSGSGEFGRVRLGRDGLDTTFDIFPGYSPASGEAKAPGPLYLFRFKHPPSWPKGRGEKEKWVLWDAANDTVGLTEHLREFCFVQLVKPKPKKTKPGLAVPKPDSSFNFVVPIKGPKGDELVELRMQKTDITQQDIELGLRETSELGFESHAQGRPVMFKDFQFE